MTYEWVIGRYDIATKNGSSILSSAQSGHGYILLNKPAGRTGDMVAAFKRSMDGPLPYHLERANALQIEKFEAISLKRSGLRE